MTVGKAFELLVKYILINVGFSEVKSDGVYIFDGTPGQMVNGLGEAHNADVLLEPPVQVPFFSMTRLLVECKHYTGKRVGLGVIRGVLGLRDDVNVFNILDDKELQRRLIQNRKGSVFYNRYYYNVAVASRSGFTDQAQNMAAAYRIPLIDFRNYTFWRNWENILMDIEEKKREISEKDIADFVLDICKGMAVAVTNTGQFLFLYSKEDTVSFPKNTYDIKWADDNKTLILLFDKKQYVVNFPSIMVNHWIENEVEVSHFTSDNMSRMVAYYKEKGSPKIEVLKIETDKLRSVIRIQDRGRVSEGSSIKKIDGDTTTYYVSE